MSDTAIKSGLDALVASAVNPIEKVEITGGEVMIQGISIMTFIGVLRKFHRIRSVILDLVGAAGEIEGDEQASRQFVKIALDTGPEAMATFVAAGMGKHNDPKTIEAILFSPTTT